MLFYLIIGLLFAALMFLLPNLLPQTRAQASMLRFWGAMTLAIGFAAFLATKGNFLGFAIPVLLPLFRDLFVNKIGGADKARAEAASTQKQTSDMSISEAREVLGVDDGADTAAIETAYKKLMAANHPDKGGSNWIAERLNTARRILLDQ